MSKTFKKVNWDLAAHERELLGYLLESLAEWQGRPNTYGDSEVSNIDHSEIQKKIQETSDSYSADFVVILFATLDAATRLKTDSAADMGRFYNDPDKKWYELKYEHDKAGHKAITQKNAGKFVPKKKEAFETHKENWHEWKKKPGGFKKSDFYREMEALTQCSEKTIREHLKIFSKDK